MNPGIVLSSLTTSEWSGITKKSTRARPSPATASKARAASSAHPLRDVVGQVRGHVDLGVLLGQVLGREVVELVLAADPDLRAAPRSRPRRPGSPGPRTRPRARHRRRLHQHLGVVLVGGDDRGVQAVGVRDLADADARSAAGGLAEHREPQGRDPSRHFCGVGLPASPGDHHAAAARAARRPRARPSCSPCPCRPRRRARRLPRSGRRPSRTCPGWCRPRPTGRAAAGRPRRPRPGCAAAATPR